MLVLNVNALDLIGPAFAKNKIVNFRRKIFSIIENRKKLTKSACVGPLANCNSLDWSDVIFTLFIHTFGAELERSCWFSDRGCLKKQKKK